MKIVLISNYIPDGQESMLRFARLLYKNYQDIGHDVKLIHPPIILGRFGKPHQGLGKWLGYIDKFFLFSLKLFYIKADIIHLCDHGNAMLIPYIKHKKHLVTCHDLLAIRSALGLVPENPTLRSGRIFQDLIVNALSQVKFAVCVSEATRQALISIVKLNYFQTQVIYSGQNFDYHKIEKENIQYRLSELSYLTLFPFILHIGDEKWYKNRPGLLRIYSLYLKQNPASQVKLVLAGKPLSNSLKQYIHELELKEKVIECIKPTNEQLEALYSAAQALLFPSLDEGFGWPVIEAQACGCPVVCSNNGSLAEVAACGTLTAPAENENELARLLEKAIHNQQTREQMIREGYENTKKFTTKRMINEYLELYQKIIDDQV
ncbi:glycosyltransferase family 1 protein [Synechococcus sp. PCC 6312]|uniref:glycosyltransferase family 4 protein n=1 Tax=Synechococcus sp. (strain ATCC 27167 / PCC 6312) TaxID=195253 RepID=UPI00029F166E|nr:glycosyltransferase family 1 protein [Synechococcus sp. PCC 6312]AFY59953.1 glycosyltransferase [Synechococcus sp. PCC 6312]